jgi:hypothetical protein
LHYYILLLNFYEYSTRLNWGPNNDEFQASGAYDDQHQKSRLEYREELQTSSNLIQYEREEKGKFGMKISRQQSIVERLDGLRGILRVILANSAIGRRSELPIAIACPASPKPDSRHVNAAQTPSLRTASRLC